MLIAKVVRSDLLHLGTREWEVHRVDDIPAPSNDGCILVWHDKPRRIPDVLVVEDGGVPAFLAWTTTYIPHLTPITALVDIAEHSSLGVRKRTRDADTRKSRHDDPLARGCIGLIHAEVAAAFHGTLAPPAAGLTPFVSTLSWLAFQRQDAPSFGERIVGLRELWEEARQLLDARMLDYSSAHVEEVWAYVTDAHADQSSAHSPKSADISAFLDSVRGQEPALNIFDAARPHAAVFEVLQTSPLELRVEGFRKLLRSLYGENNPPSAHGMLLGYALSLISQGSFLHVGLLGPSRVSDVRPLLWYGFFDFYRHTPQPGSPGTSAASLQLLRAARAGASAWRRRDITLEELRVLSRQRDSFGDALLDTRQPIAVEILDGALALIQPLPRRRTSRPRQRSMFDDMP